MHCRAKRKGCCTSRLVLRTKPYNEYDVRMFRDKMLVDAKTLCQYHVNKVEEMNAHYQSELQRERSKLYAGNNRKARARSGSVSEGDVEDYRAERAEEAEAGSHQDPRGGRACCQD
eukprot:6280044-Amphidinium_carterae.2